MSLFIAQRHAWSLARTLMVCITLFQAGDGYGAMPSADYDGDVDRIVREYDPFCFWPRGQREASKRQVGNGFAALLLF